MYRNVLNYLSDVVGGKAPYVLAVGLVVVALGLILVLLPSWRRSVQAARERGGWRGILLPTIHIVLLLVVGACIIELLRGSLLLQSNDFDRSHGRVSQVNYESVKTNWGPPHEQRELQVTHYVTEEKIVYQYKDGRQVSEEERRTITAEEAEEAAAEAEEGEDAAEKPSRAAADRNEKVETPIRRKITIRREVPQNSVVRGRVDVDIRMNYRKMGSAYYACYEDTWKLDYAVKNRCAKTTEAELRFPMPARQGVYDRFTLRVDGKDWADRLIVKDNAQVWTLPMKPGQEIRVEIGYASRGMEYVRYIPARMATRESYKVTMRIYPNVARGGEPARGTQRLVWKRDMRPPMGSMTPQSIQDSPADGRPMVLGWNLESAATTLDMGVVLPHIKQPGYYGARLLHEAPWGLVLLAGALVVTWTLLGCEINLFSLTVLAVAYYLAYTLFAYLSDHIADFATCFALAAAAALVLAAVYLWIGWGNRFAAHQTLALVAVFTIYYPLAIALDEYTGLLVQLLYWALAGYAAILAGRRCWSARRAAA